LILELSFVAKIFDYKNGSSSNLLPSLLFMDEDHNCNTVALLMKWSYNLNAVIGLASDSKCAESFNYLNQDTANMHLLSCPVP
jgi:hypothetical protein